MGKKRTLFWIEQWSKSVDKLVGCAAENIELHRINAELVVTAGNAYEAGKRFAEQAHANEVAELKQTIARGALDQ